MAFTVRETPEAGVSHYDIELDGAPVSRLRFWAHLRDDPDLRALLAETLTTTRFATYFWETPPLAVRTRARPFRFVLVDAPSLVHVQPDVGSFARRFAEGPVSVGPNLSGDAWLVIPAPNGSFPDLARFSRTAPAALVDQLWLQVGSAVIRWTETRTDTLWVSTSGLGVHWLHVRLDTRPKYYSYAPFRSPEA